MNFKLDTRTPGYIYEAVAKHIAERIRSGDLKPGTPLPAERRLADEYGVSLGTSRRATELLRDWNLVVTLRSKGTFVNGWREHRDGRDGNHQEGGGEMTTTAVDESRSTQHHHSADPQDDPIPVTV